MSTPTITPKFAVREPRVREPLSPQTAAAAKVSVRELNFYYGRAQALHNISLNIPEHGRDIYAAGTDVVDLRRRVGMVFQKSNPFPKSIFDNVAYGLRINRLTTSKAELAERVEQALNDAALWSEVKDRLKASALSLSGGQQQRLCIARALAIRPEVLLMDEPASALDPGATFKIEELIFELKKQYTIVIVTHNMQQAARVSDVTAFFLLGKLIEVNATEKMFTNPNEKLTEDYITGRFG